MSKSNKILARFSERYCRDLERDMDFGIWDYMYNKRLLSDTDVVELKKLTATPSISKDPSLKKIFVKLEKLFIKQLVSDIAHTEKYRQAKAQREEKQRKIQEAYKLKKKIERSVVKKLSPKERKLLGYMS